MALPANFNTGTLAADVGIPNHTETLTSPFLSLPRGIGDKICAYLLRAGDLAILCIPNSSVTSLKNACIAKEPVASRSAILTVVPETLALSSHRNGRSFRTFISAFTFGLVFAPTFWQFERFSNLHETNLKRECLITIEYNSKNK